jgi:phenylacetate-CoA ligase
MSERPFDPHYHLPAKTILSQIQNRSARFWEQKRKERALAVFRAASQRVPAYKDFLKKNGVSPSAILTYEDLAYVPPTNKKDYVNAYPLKDLAWDGKLDHPSVFTSTSGSTGEQTYFFRSDLIDWQCSVLQEYFVRNGADPMKPTLVLVCFGMGIWIGGIISYEAMTRLGARGYPISVITPGINKVEIFKILRKIAPSYHQTIVFGYPPFVKDLIDESSAAGVDLRKLRVRFSTAAEAYTEDFRDYLTKSVKARDPVLDTMSIYGSADIGAMAFETPTSIGIRRAARTNKHLFAELFNASQRTPTLAQFVPSFIDFEAYEGELLLTGNNSIPLVRYAIGDRGGVYSHDEMSALLAKYRHDIPKKKGDHFSENGLPFVYVFERNDFSTTLYGAQIYPEPIREVLIKRQFSKTLSGKFTLLTKYDAKHDQYLELNLELAKNGSASKTFKNKLLNSLIKHIAQKNSEYRELSRFIGARAHSRLVFWQHEDPHFFRPGIKQSWVKK